MFGDDRYGGHRGVLRQIFSFQRGAQQSRRRHRDDPAGRRLAEMAADDQHVLIGETLHEVHARLAAGFLVHVEARGPPRVGELNRVMHHVAGDHGLLAARLDEHAHVPRRVTRRREQRDFVGDLEVRPDVLDQPRFDARDRSSRADARRRDTHRCCAGGPSGRILSCRSSSAPSGTSAPTCRSPAACSSRRDRNAGACRARR